LRGQYAGARRGRTTLHDAAAAAPAGVVRVPGGRLESRFSERNAFAVSEGFFENVPRRVPGTVLDFTEVPGMAFAA